MIKTVKGKEYGKQMKALSIAYLTKNTMTTQSTHTPGPWRIQQHDSLKRVYHIDAGPIGYERETLAVINASAQSEANARLIAAAPDLLAALQQLTSDATGTGNGTGWEKARAAIAKAEGGQQ